MKSEKEISDRIQMIKEIVRSYEGETEALEWILDVQKKRK